MTQIDYGENLERLSDTTWKTSHDGVGIVADFISELPKEKKDCFIPDQELMEQIGLVCSHTR